MRAFLVLLALLVGCGGLEPPCDERFVYYLDADGDGLGSNSAAAEMLCGPTAGYAAVRGDCNDNEPRANPDGTFQTVEAAGGGWDFDCDGAEEQKDQLAGLCNLSGSTCIRSSSRWHGDTAPACGEAGMWILSCPSNCFPVREERTQACR